MAKNSGGTRVGTSKGFEWSHSDTYEDVLHDAQQIFKIEANAGLGNFMQRKPKKVSDAEYEKLLKSGDYVEVFHEGTEEHNKEIVSGKYYINDQINNLGFGYYFSSDVSYLQGTYGNNIISALIKKSDLIRTTVLKQNIEDGFAKYTNSAKNYKSGSKISEYDKKDTYGYSTAAAREGYKVLKNGGNAPYYVIIDRSALIIKKKG